jgi:hypothetical protein
VIHVGKHTLTPDPTETVPDVDLSDEAVWVHDLELGKVLDDLLDDGKLRPETRERLVRTSRSLLQGLVAAVLVAAGPAAWDYVQGAETFELVGLVDAVKVAAVTAVVAYLHPKRK